MGQKWHRYDAIRCLTAEEIPLVNFDVDIKDLNVICFITDLSKAGTRILTSWIASSKLAHSQKEGLKFQVGIVIVINVQSQGILNIGIGWLGDIIVHFHFPLIQNGRKWKFDKFKETGHKKECSKQSMRPKGPDSTIISRVWTMNIDNNDRGKRNDRQNGETIEELSYGYLS